MKNYKWFFFFGDEKIIGDIDLCVYFASNVKAQSLADSIKVPNVFTPNLDGINDVFKASIPNELEIGNYSLSIYDRYWVFIFDTKNQDSIGMEEQQVVIPALTEPIFTYYN